MSSTAITYTKTRGRPGRASLAAEPRAMSTGYCSGIPSDRDDACGFSPRDLFTENSAFYHAEKCQRPACMRIVAQVDAANPTECVVSSLYPVKLRASVLVPLYASCAALASTTAPSPPPPRATPPLPTPPPTPAPESPAGPAPTRAPPQTSSPTTTTAPPSASSEDVPSQPSETPSTGPSRTDQESSAPESVGSSPTTPSSTSPPAPHVENAEGSRTNPTSVTTRKPEGRPADAPSSIKVSNAAGGSANHTLLGIGLTVGALVLLVCIIGWRLRRQNRPGKRSSNMSKDTNAAQKDTDTTDYLLSTESTANGSIHVSADWRKQMETMLQSNHSLEFIRLNAKTITTQRLLGRGSYAFVHLVSLDDGTLLASKRLAPNQASPAKLSQLIAEVQIVSTLQHSSIVRFAGVAWTSPLDFQILFEFMEGGDLRNYLDRTRSNSPNNATSSAWTPLKLRVAAAIAEGLVYAHSFNPPLVHRDLKARNILLTRELQAKISDFGVSRYLSDSDTMTTGIGTNRWLAPEVISGGGTYTERCDIYSFGVVLTELDTHAVPLARELDAVKSEGHKRSELWLLQAIAVGNLRPAVSESCPQDIRDLAIRCLSFDPDNRPNALEVSYRLRSILRDRVITMSTS